MFLSHGLEKDGRQYTPAQMAELFETPKENVVWGRLEKMLTPVCYDYLKNPDNDWYDLLGHRLSGKPTKSGIYITKKGRKVLNYHRK